MRPLEIGLAVSATVVVLWPLVRSNRIVGATVAFGGVAVAGVQALIEGPRWQLIPLYVVLAIVAGWRLARLGREKTTEPHALPIIAGSVALLLTLALAVALPVPALPRADGPYQVGTTAWVAVDPDRPDVLSPAATDGQQPSAQREVVTQAWYPTTTPGDPAPWVSDADAFADALAPTVGLPAFTLGHLSLTRMGAALDVPIAEGSWPVVVYSHGWGAFRTVQSDLAEHLASNGYIVLSLDHTYGASATLFPQGPVLGPGDVTSAFAGQAVKQNPDALPELDDVGGDAYVEATTLLEQTFAEDVAFVLDEVAAGRVPELLGEALEVEQVGLIGHSTGGGAMVRLCLADERCVGLLGLDPWVEPVPGALLSDGLDVPFLSIRSEEWQGNDNDQILRDFHAESVGNQGLFVIPGTTHQDVTLQPFLSPLTEQLGLSGPADDRAVHAAVDQMALDFFDRVLRGQESDTDLLANPPVPIEVDG